MTSRHYEYVIVANETSQHISTLRRLVAGGFAGTILIEKPLANPGDAFELAGARPMFVAYQLRFDPLMTMLHDLLSSETLISAEIRACSYLPEWRAGRDYRQTESASIRAGGGVLRDLSHELDYTLWLFGPWRRLTAIGGHLSALEIDTDDSQAVLVETTRCRSVVVSMNYLDRQEERWIIVNTHRGTIKADLFNRTLVSNGQTLFSGSSADVDRTYVDENRAMLTGAFGHACSIAEGLAVVQMVAAIETAGREGRWVNA